MPTNNQYQNLEGCTQDLARYDKMIKYFEKDSDRIFSNVKYLKIMHDSLNLIAFRNTKETAPEFWLTSGNYKKRIEKLFEKNEKNYRKKLNAIETSRDKKVDLLSQWAGD